MTIALATTTVTVLRPNPGTDIDPYVTSDDTSNTAVYEGVRAHISAPSGAEIVAGGSQEDIQYRLNCDLIDLRHTDLVVDDETDLVYTVQWVSQRIGLGLDHVAAGLRRVTGTGA